MSTLSVPLTPKLEELVNDLVRDGFAPTKAEVMRKALRRTAEEKFVNEILEASREAHEGKFLRGDLETLARQFKD